MTHPSPSSMKWRPLRVSQIYWAANDDTRQYMEEVFTAPLEKEQTLSSWADEVNEELEPLTGGPVPVQTLKPVRDAARAGMADQESALREDFRALLVSEEECHQLRRRAGGRPKAPTLAERRREGLSVEELFDTTLSVAMRTAILGIGTATEGRLRAEAVAEATEAATQGTFDWELGLLYDELGPIVAPRGLCLLLNRNVNSEVIKDVLTAAGRLDAEGIALSPEDRLPLMIYAGTFNPKGMSKSPWPKVPGTYDEAVKGLARWLNTGDETDVPKILRRWTDMKFVRDFIASRAEEN